MRRTVRTMCAICGYHLLDVEVEDGQVVKVSAAPVPENRGDGLCVKATEALPWNYREGRVIHPLLRRGKGGPWRRASWDEALDVVAERLREVRRRYGPEALWLYYGTGFILGGIVGMHAMGQFAEAFGTPNTGSWAENCYLPKVVSNVITFGSLLAADLDPEASPGSIFVWGSNPSASLPPLATRIRRFKRNKGTKLVVIDPRRIPLAREADLYLPVRPGTDTALALAMINVIIEEEIYEHEFVKQYTSGFDRLVSWAQAYRPEYVEEIVGIPAPQIREAAHIFALSKPTAVVRFLGGFETTPNGFQGHRAVDVLLAITGNVDNESGNIMPDPPTGWLINRAVEKLRQMPGLGSDFHPVFQKICGYAVGSPLANAVLKGEPYPIKALIVCGGNPALTHANSAKIREALEKLDLVVQLDLRFNDTSRFADVFLPAQAPLEKQELASFWSALDNDIMGVVERVLPPPGECLPDYEILWRLGEKLGFQMPRTFEEGCKLVLSPLGITLEELRQKPYYYSRKNVKKYRQRGFNTPSGKVEIYSTILEQHGFSPLPIYMEPPESPRSLPSLAQQYPLIAIDFRVPHYFHTRFREIPALRKLSPEPTVEIHPRDAERFGISDGDLVRVESLRGAVEVRAKVTEDIREGVVGMEMGWSGKGNFNLLTSDELHHREPVTGGAMYRAFLCRVMKVEEEKR